MKIYKGSKEIDLPAALAAQQVKNMGWSYEKEIVEEEIEQEKIDVHASDTEELEIEEDK